MILIARVSAVPMRDATAFWGMALWIPAIICFLNLLQTLAFVWWSRSLPQEMHIPSHLNRVSADADKAGSNREISPPDEKSVANTSGLSALRGYRLSPVSSVSLASSGW